MVGNYKYVMPSVCYQYYGELGGFSLSAMIVLTNKHLSYKDCIEYIFFTKFCSNEYIDNV
jgi:hypothetical protein